MRRARAHYENRTRSYRVSDFLRDAEIGAKRLCSMPDRVTNTRAGDGNDDATDGDQSVRR